MGQWAIAIGINQYHKFQPLSYAQQDAEALQQFLVQAGVPAQNCLLLTDTSPPIFDKSTSPTQAGIQTWLDALSQQPLHPGDGVWFFFSGYGVCHEGQDYLVPIDGDPSLIRETAIPFRVIFDRLRAISPASVLVLLDMNRSQGMVSNEIVGNQVLQLAKDAGIATILSCQPDQFSREVAGLGHGVFTAALLEKLHDSQGATLANLSRYLSARVPELGEHHQRPIQQPIVLSSAVQMNQPVLLKERAVASGRSSQTDDSPLQPDQSPFQLPSDDLWQPPRQGYAIPKPTHSPTHSTMTSRSTPPNSEPGDRPAPQISDAQFWRPLLLWGSLAVVALLGGVLWKNWSAITQGSPPSSSTVQASSKPKPAISVTPAAPETQLPPGRVALERARARTKSDQVTAYAAAIQEASKIQPNQPEYAESRQAIDEWSQEILNLARQQAKQQQFDRAVLTAAYIPDPRADGGSREIQAEIGRWCKALNPNPAKDTAQQQARDFCRKRGL